MSKTTSRREFLKASAWAGAGFWVASRPRQTWGASPNEKLNIAKVGCANMGWQDLNGVSGENIVALCDVDEALAAQAFKKFDKAERFNDYRRMFDKMHKQIDAVVVSTPDHMHAPISLAAMQLGKHVYCQKPLTHTVAEARRVAEAARKYRVVTQMGNQGHSNPKAREAVDIVRSGAIGAVREVYAWSDRPGNYWPQGIDRPTETPPVPSTLDWNLWLGVAPERPYNPAYHPSKWRGWWDFGTGSMGDMGCHVCDVAFWALALREPTAVDCEVSGLHKETGAKWAKITWEFRARGVPWQVGLIPGQDLAKEFPAGPTLPPVKLHWYDGGKQPPKELFEGKPIDGNASLLIGDKGKLYVNDGWCGSYVLLPEKQFEGYQPPKAGLRRVPEGLNHYTVWIDTVKKGFDATQFGQGSYGLLSDFEYAGAMTGMLLLGNVAARTGKRIEWDARKMKVTNLPEANQYIDPPYRKGWEM
jgi:predicted dehydrogenase